MDGAEPAAVLIAQALRHTPDDDEYWAVVHTLQRRATREDFAAALTLCHSGIDTERRLGANIIAQLGYDASYPYQAEAEPVVLSLLNDPSGEVAASAAFGAGHQRLSSAIPALVRLAQHPDEDLRYAAAHGLMVHDDPAAVRTLITLSADPAARVRDWATFGLGTILDTDTPQVRAALYARLADADVNTRDEAIAGLAARHDPRATAPLIAALSGETASDLILATAAAATDPGVRAALEAFGPPDHS